MKISSLHKKIKSIYKSQISNDQLAFKNRSVIHKENSLMDSINKLIEDHKLDFGEKSEFLEKTISQLMIASNEINAIAESTPKTKTITHNEFEEKTLKEVDEYKKAVNAYSENGGKGFYDFGIQAVFSIEQYEELFKKALSQAESEGLDIIVLEEDSSLSESQIGLTDYRGSISLLMPSSQLEKFKSIMESVDSILVENDSCNRYAPKYHSVFIMPYFREHPQCTVDSVREYLEHTKDTDTSHRIENAFTLMGVFRSDVSTTGYPFIDSDRHIVDSMKRAFTSIDIYSKERGKGQSREHVNGLMPNLYVYGADELKSLGVSEGKTLDISIPREIELHDLELKKTKELTR